MTDELKNKIHKLPFEIQNKILYYTMIHPCSNIIKDLKKDYENINNTRINLDTNEYEPENFYECLCSMGFLNGKNYRNNSVDDVLYYIIQKMRNYEEIDEDDLLFLFSSF
tara:strand:- start:657 stop:986 length:330 start_codon:yes stop_codon:yes gene_type:complete